MVTGRVVATRGDRQAVFAQDLADRLDPETVPVGVDEIDQYLPGRSSSAAKKAEAAFKISFARRSSAFSFFNRLICSASSVLVPGRRPWSTSAWRTHLRSCSGDPIPACWPRT